MTLDYSTDEITLVRVYALLLESVWEAQYRYTMVYVCVCEQHVNFKKLALAHIPCSYMWNIKETLIQLYVSTCSEKKLFASEPPSSKRFISVLGSLLLLLCVQQDHCNSQRTQEATSCCSTLRCQDHQSRFIPSKRIRGLTPRYNSCI